MKTRRTLLAAIAAGAIILAACGGDDAESSTEAAATTTTTAETTTTAPPTTTTVAPTTTTTEPAPPPGTTLTLDVTGFPPLAGGVHYEGWAIIDGAPVTTGKFNVNEAGDVIGLDGAPVEAFATTTDLTAATAIVVTIEASGDTDTTPAETHFVAGDVTSGAADLDIAHPAAIGTDFADAAGALVLATPSTDTKDDELSGIWFLTLPGPEAGLSLPDLPAGWVYEGWAVIDGIPVSSGRFTDVAAADQSAPFGGPGRMPTYPGEDFVSNAPEGLTFPTDLSGATVVVSVEPEPDDDAAPFALKPLVGDLPADAEEEPVAYDLANVATNLPAGVATIS